MCPRLTHQPRVTQFAAQRKQRLDQSCWRMSLLQELTAFGVRLNSCSGKATGISTRIGAIAAEFPCTQRRR